MGGHSRRLAQVGQLAFGIRILPHFDRRPGAACEEFETLERMKQPSLRNTKAQCCPATYLENFLSAADSARFSGLNLSYLPKQIDVSRRRKALINKRSAVKTIYCASGVIRLGLKLGQLVHIWSLIGIIFTAAIRFSLIRSTPQMSVHHTFVRDIKSL